VPEITYYALVSETNPPERPAGLVRRIHTEPMPTDEVFRRDLQWHPTEYLQRYWLGHRDQEHVEITEAEAERIMARWRERFGTGD
jgi:hypothetical protein